MSTPVQLATKHPFANADTLRGILIAASVTVASYLIGMVAGWATSVNWLEAFAVFTSYVCTYLCVKQRRVNYVFGAISTLAYCLLFWQQGLLASMALNAYLTPALVYGWIRWRSDSNSRPVTRVQLRWVPVYVLVAVSAFAGAVLINSALGGRFATLDAVILVGTLLAQFLMDNKKIENWIVWMVVNVIAICVYFEAGLRIAALQYVFFLGNAVWALFVWRHSMIKGRQE